MTHDDTSVGNPTPCFYDEGATPDTAFISCKVYDSLKKLQILLAVDVLSRAGISPTTDSIEYVTRIPRKRIVDLIRRYSCRYGLLTKTPRTENDTAKLRGYFVYHLTKKGRYTLTDMIVRFNGNRNIRRRKNDFVEDHSDIVLLPGLSDEFMAALDGESDDTGDVIS